MKKIFFALSMLTLLYTSCGILLPILVAQVSLRM